MPGVGSWLDSVILKLFSNQNASLNPFNLNWGFQSDWKQLLCSPTAQRTEGRAGSRRAGRSGFGFSPSRRGPALLLFLITRSSLTLHVFPCSPGGRKHGRALRCSPCDGAGGRGADPRPRAPRR